MVDGRKRIAIFHGPDDALGAEMVGGGWTGEGCRGVADDATICISRRGRDMGRLRCMTVVRVDGVATKVNADGSLGGACEGFSDGKAL